MSGLLDAVQFLADLIDGKVSLIKPPVPIEMNPAPGSPADNAWQGLRADVADGNRFRDLRKQYEDEYQFLIHGGYSDDTSSKTRWSLWNPGLYLQKCHLSAAIEVGAILDRRPQDVLAVWLVEGQAKFSLHLPALVWKTSRATTRIEVLQAIRSWVLWYNFGSDRLSATYQIPGDRTWCQPDRRDDKANQTHEQKYQAVQQEIAAVPKMTGPFIEDPNALESYLTSIGGAFHSLTVTDTGTSQEYPATLPAGVEVQASGALASDCIGALLYVEAALFAMYQNDTETLLKAEYAKDAAQIDLSEKPWATYLGWNGHLKDWTDKNGQHHDGQYTMFLKGAADYPAAIAEFFGGDTVAGPPPSTLLGDKYPDQLTDWRAIKAVPFCNAVTVKYLSEACSAWFS